MEAISVADLRKRFGPLPVLQGLNLQVNEGEVYGLLGPNGAGKSTLIHLLLGFLRPDGGQLRVLGQSAGQACRRVGYLPERVRYQAHISAREYLRSVGAFSDLDGAVLASRCPALLQMVGLSGHANRRLGEFSKGMLQRLGIAQALLHDPDLLLIDEPTSGLDPAGQREAIDLLAELRRRGHTILMCTHQIAEAEGLCDRVGILSGGRLVEEAQVADLARARRVTIKVRSGALPGDTLRALSLLAPAVAAAGREVRVADDEDLQRRVLRLLLDAHLTIAEVKPAGSGVEEMYLRVTRGGRPGEGSASTRDALPLAGQPVGREGGR